MKNAILEMLENQVAKNASDFQRLLVAARPIIESAEDPFEHAIVADGVMVNLGRGARRLYLYIGAAGCPAYMQDRVLVSHHGSGRWWVLNSPEGRDCIRFVNQR